MATYAFEVDGQGHALELVFVEGTRGRPYLFGEGADTLQVEVQDFHIARCAVTVALWTHVMGTNPAIHAGQQHPVENVSWIEITRSGGFLDRINAQVRLSGELPSEARFRLPSETEWEYAARGGPHWRQGFCYSGGNDIEPVAWYQGNSLDSMHDVALKSPNQLGLYDMSGNTWEWCQDTYTPDVGMIPVDGSPFRGDGPERVLRGGCFHNWAIHCTVSKRYQIDSDYRDGCIGLRLALA